MSDPFVEATLEMWRASDPLEAVVAVFTEEEKGEYFITLGPGDHSSQRWKLSESLAKKIRREINERLD